MANDILHGRPAGDPPGDAHPPKAIPCEKIQDLLFDYLSHELGEKQSWIVREHLRTCPACAREAAQLAATVEMLKGGATPDVPARLPETVRRRLARALLHPVLDWMYDHRRLTAWTAALLAVALVLLVAWLCRFKPDTVIYWLR